ncbi:MAG: hypothetical protein HOI66_18040 [Verrucomicrobia bacterium]|jgi:hypothetical protein|nr:hypothetical protein [Verrucomicrobiota bacterium]
MRPFHVKNLFIRSWMAAMVMVSLETKGVTVVSIADQDVRPGSVVTVPIRLETDDDVIGVQIDVFYDAQQLIASLASGDESSPTEVVVKSSLLSAGHQRLAVYSLGENSLPNQQTVQLNLVIPPDIPRETTVIRLEGLIIGGAGEGPGNLESETRDGVLSIVVVPDEIDLTGLIRYYSSDQVMPEVLVHGQGEGGSDGLSDEFGRFKISVPSEVAINLSAEKSSELPPNRGVTSLDLLLMRRHILGLVPFESPWQRLAADVDLQGDIGAIDVLLMRRLILGLAEDFVPGQPLFQFYPTATNFEDPFNPWSAPQSFEYASLSVDLFQQDFSGLKLGDVDGDWASGPDRLELGNRLTTQSIGGAWEPVGLYVEEWGEEMEGGAALKRFAFMGSNLEAVSALQFTIGWDRDELVFDSVSEVGLPGLTMNQFGLTQSLLDQGQLTFAWTDPKLGGSLIDPDGVLFVVNFQPLLSGGEGVSFLPGPTSLFAARGVTPSNVITYRSELIESEKVVVDIRSIISEAAEGNVVVEVESESDGSYFFECSESLPTVNWKFLSRLEGTGRTLRFEDMVSNQQNRFYRVRKQFAANSSRGSLK